MSCGLTSCGRNNVGTGVPASPPASSRDDSSTPSSSGAKRKVGLVTDVGGVNDKSFNQSAWKGVQDAMKAFGIEGRFVESKQPTDYEKNIDQFVHEGYNPIITVGFLMGDATRVKAKQYPNVHFLIIDFAYKAEEYQKDLKNVTSLMFREDEVGFLAGVVAGGMTKTGVIGAVCGMEIPPVVRFAKGYESGAKWMRPDVKVLITYIASFTDPTKGKETARSMINQGADVIFGVGGTTGNGGLREAKDAGVMAIGVDVDQYLTYPEVRSALVTSAMKNVDVAVFNALKELQEKGTLRGGVRESNLRNGGIGLAPFHDWEDKVPQRVRDKVKEAIEGLKAGQIATGYKP
ncbi:MAG: BMP family ABC transporter substrate-binding protein [Abditibacteriales bacterium]|nr:BMP family ABC transporter substrate-binding protein [Abditibacteriales bacterium]MDW8366440.1 BMP family ABC transporter substrate-binding protein [Abditibacteriales bacterium]